MHSSRGRQFPPAVSLLAISLCAAAFFLLSGPRPEIVKAAARKPARAQDAGAKDPRLQNAYRFERGGWTYVHLEGTPEQIGFQHGYLLAPEIADAFAAVKLEDTHTKMRDWSFFQRAAHDMLWPHIEA